MRLMDGHLGNPNRYNQKCKCLMCLNDQKMVDLYKYYLVFGIPDQDAQPVDQRWSETSEP